MTSEQRRIAKRLAESGYGRLLACEPSIEPNAYYTLSEVHHGPIYVLRVFLGDQGITLDEQSRHQERWGATRALADLLCVDADWTPTPL